jgi:Uma2 family endonuclease
MPVTAETYRLVAREDPEGRWELHRGALREKPSMSYDHNYSMMELGYQLRSQLNATQYQVRINAGRVARIDETYYIPDVYVIPVELTTKLRGRSDLLEIYDESLPFVAEIWSRSTGAYDVDEKLPEYQRSGDLQIWRLHPYERTLTTWRRQDDGRYEQEIVQGGRVRLFALSTVTIDLDALFT